MNIHDRYDDARTIKADILKSVLSEEAGYIEDDSGSSPFLSRVVPEDPLTSSSGRQGLTQDMARLTSDGLGAFHSLALPVLDCGCVGEGRRSVVLQLGTVDEPASVLIEMSARAARENNVDIFVSAKECKSTGHGSPTPPCKCGPYYDLDITPYPSLRQPYPHIEITRGPQGDSAVPSLHGGGRSHSDSIPDAGKGEFSLLVMSFGMLGLIVFVLFVWS